MNANSTQHLGKLEKINLALKHGDLIVVKRKADELKCLKSRVGCIVGEMSCGYVRSAAITLSFSSRRLRMRLSFASGKQSGRHLGIRLLGKVNLGP